MSNQNASGPSQRQTRQYQAALHEAGHAVTAYYLGFQVKSVNIRREGETNGSTYVSFWRAKPGVIQGTLAVLFTYMAGEAAICAINGRDGQEADHGLAQQTDLTCAVNVATALVTNYLESYGMADAEDKPLLLEQIAHGFCTMLFTQAAELLAGPVIKGQVEAVAGELLRHKQLSGQQFEQLMEQMPDRAFAARRLRACLKGLDLQDAILIAAYGYQAASADRA